MAKRDRRNAIMRAAEKLFKTGRIHEITLDDVIREAGVGKGTVYRYFKDKDDLFFQTASRGFEDLCELVTEKGRSGASFEKRLVGICEEVVNFFQTRRKLHRMMHSEEAKCLWDRKEKRQRWLQRRQRLIGAVAVVLDDGVAKGDVREDVPPEALAAFLLGLLRAWSWMPPGASEPKIALRQLIDLFLNGAGLPVAPPKRAHS